MIVLGNFFGAGELTQAEKEKLAELVVEKMKEEVRIENERNGSG